MAAYSLRLLNRIANDLWCSLQSGVYRSRCQLRFLQAGVNTLLVFCGHPRMILRKFFLCQFQRREIIVLDGIHDALDRVVLFAGFISLFAAAAQHTIHSAVLLVKALDCLRDDLRFWQRFKVRQFLAVGSHFFLCIQRPLLCIKRQRCGKLRKKRFLLLVKRIKAKVICQSGKLSVLITIMLQNIDVPLRRIGIQIKDMQQCFFSIIFRWKSFNIGNNGLSGTVVLFRHKASGGNRIDFQHIKAIYQREVQVKDGFPQANRQCITGFGVVIDLRQLETGRDRGNRFANSVEHHMTRASDQVQRTGGHGAGQGASQTEAAALPPCTSLSAGHTVTIQLFFVHHHFGIAVIHLIESLSTRLSKHLIVLCKCLNVDIDHIVADQSIDAVVQRGNKAVVSLFSQFFNNLLDGAVLLVQRFILLRRLIGKLDKIQSNAVVRSPLLGNTNWTIKYPKSGINKFSHNTHS